jgi:hypothetical protein
LPMSHNQLQQQLQACLYAHLPGVVPSNACSRRKAAFDASRWLSKVQSPAGAGNHA